MGLRIITTLNSKILFKNHLVKWLGQVGSGIVKMYNLITIYGHCFSHLADISKYLESTLCRLGLHKRKGPSKQLKDLFKYMRQIIHVTLSMMPYYWCSPIHKFIKL